MDIWLDTSNISIIQYAVKLGLLAGVTTNPAIIANAKRDCETVLEDLLHYQEGPVTVQVLSEEVEEMVQEGQNFYSISNRLIIKVPMTKNGLEAIHLLSRQGIPTMATVVYQPHQALMAALAGADYVAPYLGRLEQNGGDPWNLLKNISEMFHHYKLKTKILGASLVTIDHFLKCAEIGIPAVTIKEELFEKLIETDLMTEKSVEEFMIKACVKQ